MNASERERLHAAMVRFADGERAAFREVFDRLWPLCLSLSTRLLANRADAEDAAQRALLKVFDRIVDFDRERDGGAWAMTITVFEVLTLRKQRQRRREDAVEVNVEDGRALAADALADHEIHVLVHELIGEMSESDHEALEAMLEGIIPRGEAARKRRFRALERLRAAWRKAHG